MIYFRDNIYIIKTLKEFQFVDEYGKDQGANVRQKAKDITNLLQDDARLRQERRSRAHMRDRMLGQNGEEEDQPSRPSPVTRNGGGGGGDDEELRKAIEASKRSLAAEQAKTAEERDLAQALKLSEEEEARRLKALQDQNGQGLFDDQAQACVTSACARYWTGMLTECCTVIRRRTCCRSMHSRSCSRSILFSLSSRRSSRMLSRRNRRPPRSVMCLIRLIRILYVL